MEKVTYRETVQKPHGVCVREFVDMDGGVHYKWTRFQIDGREYPVSTAFDILRHEEIDWANTVMLRDEGDKVVTELPIEDQLAVAHGYELTEEELAEYRNQPVFTA